MEYLKNACVLGQSAKGRYPQLYAWETERFYAMQAPYSTDYFKGECQGLDESDFYAYTSCGIRLSDILNPSTGEAYIEDYKLATWACPARADIPLGAKVNIGDNVYLVANPANQSSVLTSAVLRRCNAVYHFLDYYGNVLEEPFVWSRNSAQAVQNQYQDNMVLMAGHQKCLMQLNENTKKVHHNTRMILGRQCYQITGMVDFLREYTTDAKSIHLMAFDLHQVEPDANDDIENQVSGGEPFTWEILINGPTKMAVSSQYTFSASSLRNGQPPEQPVSYLWECDGEAGKIDQNGNFTALQQGSCTISCILKQNQNIRSQITVAVDTASSVVLLGQLPRGLEQLEHATIQAAVYQGGQPTQEVVEWRLAGPQKTAYGADVNENTLTITCYMPDPVPLRITALYGNMQESVEILLEGY